MDGWNNYIHTCVCVWIYIYTHIYMRGKTLKQLFHSPFPLSVSTRSAKSSTLFSGKPKRFCTLGFSV